MNSVNSFRPNLSRIDAILAEHLGITYDLDDSTFELADEVLTTRPAVAFKELFPPSKEMPGHFGKLARSAWTYVDQVFKPADLPGYGPPDAHAKSVQIADVYERFLADPSSSNIYLELRLDESEPALVPFPGISSELLTPRSGTSMVDTRSELRILTSDACERLNLILPVARSLAVPSVKSLDEASE